MSAEEMLEQELKGISPPKNWQIVAIMEKFARQEVNKAKKEQGEVMCEVFNICDDYDRVMGRLGYADMENRSGIEFKDGKWRVKE